jgi:hypothetical protein
MKYLVFGVLLLSLSAQAQTPVADAGDSRVFVVTIRHLYAGGFARLFGASVISTEMFVVPSGGGGSGFNQGGFGVQNNRNGGFQQAPSGNQQNSLGSGFGF